MYIFFRILKEVLAAYNLVLVLYEKLFPEIRVEKQTGSTFRFFIITR
jgi:hypothetical protein